MSNRDDPTHHRDPEEEDEQSGFQRWVLPYFEDSSLWPVLLVVMIAIAAFLAPVLLYAIYYLELRSLLATLILLIITAQMIRFEWRVRGRPGGLAGALAAVWGMAIAAVVYGVRAGLL